MSDILPPPWHVKETDRDGDFVQFEVRAANGNLVATPYYVTKDGAEVAHLIAAAPELYARLADLERAAQAHLDSTDGSEREYLRDECFKARAAIAKATGP